MFSNIKTDLFRHGQEELVEESRIHFWGDQEAVEEVDYKNGDYIEVKLQQGADHPCGWWLAKIIERRDNLFFVHYENYDNVYDEIVLINQIRPVNAREGPKLEETERIAKQIPNQA